MKTVFKILLALIVVLVIAVLVLFMQIDRLAKTGIEKGGTFALGVPTTVDDVSIKLFGGTVGMNGLQVDNPDGFASPYLMRNGAFNLAVDSGSLMSDEITVDLIALNGLDVYIEKNDAGNNLSPILDHLKQFEGGETASESTGESKKFIVKRLEITGVKAHLDVPVIGKKTVEVPDIVLEDLTQDNADGLLMSELMARIFPMITAATLQSLSDLPADLLGTLNGDLSAVADNLGGNVGELIKNPGAMLEGAGEQVQEVLDETVGNLGENLGEGLGDEAGDALEGAGEKIQEGIGNIFGGSEDE